MKINQLNSIETFEPWLNKITLNLCLQYISKNKNNDCYEDNICIDANEYELQEIDNIILEKEFKNEIISAIYELTEYQRMVIMLFYYFELSIKEIAELMKCSEGTVKSRLFYGKSRLKEKILR